MLFFLRRSCTLSFTLFFCSFSLGNGLFAYLAVAWIYLLKHLVGTDAAVTQGFQHGRCDLRASFELESVYKHFLEIVKDCALHVWIAGAVASSDGDDDDLIFFGLCFVLFRWKEHVDFVAIVEKAAVMSANCT